MRDYRCRLAGALTLIIAAVAWPLETAELASAAEPGLTARSISADRVHNIFGIIVDTRAYRNREPESS